MTASTRSSSFGSASSVLARIISTFGNGARLISASRTAAADSSDGDDTAAHGREEGRNRADTGVGIDDGVRRRGSEAVAHEGDHALSLRGVDLEEGCGGDLERHVEEPLRVGIADRFPRQAHRRRPLRAG